ncbi:hypothetical protein IQ249_12475 [Lusitaniella coriacea LEGE 07157]|uniref:Uncharacterized protein n=1 Tax=Lusitaniella coriacea LEGE 07157 TaxID=945747 RepID=A0A8J7DWY8_9CYAN|nr:hypothetical protein [Lusitaniella coriacea]MBE9116716.1 hypothetical protein [Lusitaniella coriacea LEGE 07157]
MQFRCDGKYLLPRLPQVQFTSNVYDPEVLKALSQSWERREYPMERWSEAPNRH